MKFKSLLIIILLCCFNIVNAQNVLKGTVKDAATGKALVSVNIFITELQKGTVTNDNGEYSFNDLPSGKIHIQFSYIGYKSVVKSIFVNNKEKTLDVELQPSNVELSPVVVLGNSINELDYIPYKVESISSKQLNTSGFVTLTKSLTRLPGVSQLSNGLAISKPVIRGFYGYRIAEIVDGVKFDNQEWQNEHGFGMDDIGIGSVELIQGPASLIYGADAMGGVIKLVDPVNAPVGHILGEYNLSIYSNTLGAKTSVGFKGAGKHWSWQLYGGGESNADYLDGNGKKIENTRFAGLSAKGILGYTSDWGFSNLEYSFSHHLFGVVEANSINNPTPKKEEDRFERAFEGPHHIVDFHIVSLKNMFFTGDSKFKVNLGFQNNHRVEDEGNENNAASSSNKDAGELDVIRNTFSFDGEWIYPFFEDGEITLGTQGNVKSNENDGGRILVPNADMNEFSGFAYLKNNFGKVIVEGGLRYDKNSITSTEMGIKDSVGYMKALDLSFNTVNGSIGGTYNFDEKWIVKLNFATGYRPPNLSELSSNGVHEGTTRYELGNSNMRTEKNFQFDGGIIFRNSITRLSLTAFDNQVKDYIYLFPSSDSIESYQVYKFLQTDATLYGGEFSLDVKASRLLDITASYSTVIGKTNAGEYLPLMPADKILANLQFNFYDLGWLHDFVFNIGARGYLEQTRESKNELTTPGYVLVDASVDGKIYWGNQPINLSITATNLLDKAYINNLSLLRPLGLYDIGRNISLSVNLPLNLD